MISSCGNIALVLLSVSLLSELGRLGCVGGMMVLRGCLVTLVLNMGFSSLTGTTMDSWVISVASSFGMKDVQ